VFVSRESLCNHTKDDKYLINSIKILPVPYKYVYSPKQNSTYSTVQLGLSTTEERGLKSNCNLVGMWFISTSILDTHGLLSC